MSNISREPTEEAIEQLREEMEELVSAMCKALNDPKRLMVLYALREGELSVGELSTLLASPQSNVSQHLAILRDRGLIEAGRHGNNVFYSLRHPKVLEAIDVLRQVMHDELIRRREIMLLD